MVTSNIVQISQRVRDLCIRIIMNASELEKKKLKTFLLAFLCLFHTQIVIQSNQNQQTV